jgi:hypothetical protein
MRGKALEFLKQESSGNKIVVSCGFNALFDGGNFHELERLIPSGEESMMSTYTLTA